MSTDRPGYLLPFRLLQGFRVLIDALHVELAREGHPDVRPVHGFVLQALGDDGATAVELGNRLGVTKQAAAKHVEALERMGYVRRGADPSDARRKPIRLTERGLDCLERSARIFDELRADWVARLGADRVCALEDDLSTMAGSSLRTDLPGWLGLRS